MLNTRKPACWLATLLLLALGGCASLETREPLDVAVAGVESLPGEGMEFQMLLKLRVKNPNDAALEYDGVYLKMEVLDKTFATGVSDERGTIPRFGESIVAVPMTVSVGRMIRQVVGMLDGQPVDKITYTLEGKLSGAGMSSRRFSSKGVLELPKAASPDTSSEGI
jgi:LEA14-like dessication related protein